LNGIDGALRAPIAQRSGEAGRKRGVGKMNARLALAFADAKIRLYLNQSVQSSASFAQKVFALGQVE